MREPAFWREGGGGLCAALLAPLAAGYGAVAARRMARPGHAPGVPVICIGNPTLGGAGKTPTALCVGRILRDAGRRPFFLSRGYGGSFKGPLRVEPERRAASEVGDEPLLLARLAPTIVARDRVAGAAMARDLGADVIVMDDGFQNPSLAKTLSILVVDARRGLGNGRVFPAGPLRAPLAAQLDRAQALLAVGDGDGAQDAVGATRARGLAVHRGRLVPDEAALAALRGRPVLAFAGIGDPGKFFATLADAGIDVRAQRAFADHHAYRGSEAADLLRQARCEGLVPVTTEKDWVRLAGQDEAAAALAAAATPLPVTLQIEDEAAFRALILSACN